MTHTRSKRKWLPGWFVIVSTDGRIFDGRRFVRGGYQEVKKPGQFATYEKAARKASALRTAENATCGVSYIPGGFQKRKSTPEKSECSGGA